MSTIEFSVVMPIKNEAHLIRYSIPSVVSVNPAEIVLCFDKPADSHTFNVAKRIVERLGAEEKTKFLEVERNSKFRLHQAWVRRSGFLKASYDKILTVDADLFVYPAVLKAIDMVGKNNIGLASCEKVYSLLDFHSFWRVGVDKMKTLIVKNRGSFTGLYAFWRPFWLETEDDFVERISASEDVHLCLGIMKKYRCVFLKDVGGFCLGIQAEDKIVNQFRAGQWFAQYAGFRRMLFHSIFSARFLELWGFLHERFYPGAKMGGSPGFYFTR